MTPEQVSADRAAGVREAAAAKDEAASQSALRQAEAGTPVTDVCRQLGIAPVPFLLETVAAQTRARLILMTPYMIEADECPPGRYTLEAGKRGFIYIKKVDSIKRGVRLWAYVKICTEKKPGQTCVEKTVQFQF